MMNITTQMRENPISLLLIGAGIGLMVTRNMTMSNSGYQGGMGTYRDKSENMMGRAQEAVSSQAQNIRDTMMETYSSASETVSDMTDRAAEYTQRATSGLSTLATEQPLVLGALGLLAGAALAAMLPRTQLEEEYVTPAARQLRDQASSMASETLQRAKGVASKAAEVVSSEFSGESHENKSGSTGGPTSSGQGSKSGMTAGSGGARPTENISAGQGSSGNQG